MAAGQDTAGRSRPPQTVLDRTNIGVDRRDRKIIERFSKKIVIYKGHRYSASVAGNGAFFLWKQYNVDPHAPGVPSGFAHYTHLVSTGVTYNADLDQTKAGLEMINDGAH
jgi:hypothetical protein